MASTGKDLANSRLATPVDSTRTSIKITSGEVSMFPLGADFGEEFFVTVTPYGKLPNQNNSEIMRVTSVNNGSNILTVERGAKGTTAKEFLEGDIVSNGIYRDELGGSGGGGGKKGIVYNSASNKLTLTDSENGGASLPNIVTGVQNGVTAWNATYTNQAGAQVGFKVAPAELRISGNQLTLEGSNTVNLPSGGGEGGGTPQTLSLSGKKLAISQGNEVDLSTVDEKQTLSLSGNTLYISGGNSVELPAGGGGGGGGAPSTNSPRTIYAEGSPVGNNSAPEKVAAAKNGARFISSDGGGVGAWEWVKSNNKWQITNGDTGLLELNSFDATILQNGIVKMRRINDIVYAFVGNNSLEFNMSGKARNRHLVFQPKKGWTPASPASVPWFDRNFKQVGTFSVFAGFLALNLDPSIKDADRPQSAQKVGLMTYITKDDWPTSLE